MADNIGGIYAAIREARREVADELRELRVRVRRLERWLFGLVCIMLFQGGTQVPWSALMGLIHP